MRMLLMGKGLALGLAVLCVAGSVSSADDEQEKKQEKKVQRIEVQIEEVAEEDGKSPKTQLFRAADGSGARVLWNVETQLSKYWLGVHCEPVSGALKSQLNLDDGLVAVHVVKGSPAAKAGVKDHDVLLAIGGTRLKSVEGLVKIMSASKGEPTTLTLLRGGSEREIDVTPAKRPEPQAGGGANLLLKAIPNWVPGDKNEDSLRYLFVHPGVRMPENLLKDGKQLSLSISRTGEGPAKITVKQGDKAWNVVEGKLDKLPKEIRVHVENALTGKAVKPDAEGNVERRAQIRLRPGATAPRIQFRQFQAAEGGLEQIQNELKELRKEIELLKKQTPKPAKKPRSRPRRANEEEEESLLDS